MVDRQGDHDQEREWVPEFEGQRPPFAPGEQSAELARKRWADSHGAYSPRRRDPIARELVDLILKDDTVPAYAKSPAYRLELWALCRSEAMVQLVLEWLDRKADEDEADGVGDLSDDSVRSAHLLLHRAETRAASARQRLGLTPVSAARMGRDVAVGGAATAQADVARLMAELHRLDQQGKLPADLAAAVEQVEGAASSDDDAEGEGSES